MEAPRAKQVLFAVERHNTKKMVANYAFLLHHIGLQVGLPGHE